jgi:DNA-directed RNA polymerase subunit alpha
MEKKVTYEEFVAAMIVINQYKSQVEFDHERIKNFDKIKGFSFNMQTKDTLISEADLSVRALNCLMSSHLKIEKIGDLGDYTINELAKSKNFGKKTLVELRDLCYLCGFTFKQ